MIIKDKISVNEKYAYREDQVEHEACGIASWFEQRPYNGV